ncbi:MAG TPA: carbohydrate ABC transporter permease [Ornithinimicrobium sp.]|uniref:carbohydrate ABC transporter permease n=1 Tax=Ornithinimicrobium sp. TaxID=1977084 RepID=UPI002B4954E7|nr:carbohydrate ABC transporter permease [Ornithinimicrobium sp.]HKJ12708.1 carbohydrate ABC transporter permease [Ornithinimicrobium sp.]
MNAGKLKDGRPRSPFSMVVMTALAVLWTIPTLGLFITSFRTRDDALTSGWWSTLVNPFGTGWTLDNYRGVLTGQDMAGGLVNSIVIAIPATIIPIMFAAFAAYAFTFMKFPGKDVLFIIIVGILVIPIQVAFAPMLDLLGPNGLNLAGDYIAVWLLHTGFGMPLAIYVLRNYMATLPTSVIESAKIDGCTHFQTFWRLVAPMAVPAMAAFATLQFLWVWNDLLIAKLFLDQRNTTVIVLLQQLLGTQGQGAELVTAGAFLSIIIPMIVFVSLQRYFVRGLTSGAVKG